MKKFSILIFACLINFISCTKPKDVSKTNTTNTNNKVEIEEDNTIYNINSIDVKPDFEKGIEKLQKFIRFNYKYPEEEGLIGKVNANFIVEKDGTLSDIKITRDIGFGTGSEAIRVLKKCPKWTPGKHNNKLVRVRYYLTIPINTNHEQTP